MKLFQHPFSTTSIKVRALIEELGLECELVTIDLMKGENKKPEFLARNPNGKIPTLEDEGFHVWESNAISCYLAALKPERGLMPTDPRSLGRMHQWLHWYSTTFSPDTIDVLMETVYARFFGREKDEKKYAEGMEKVRRDLGVLEKGLEGQEYLCGKLSVADFSLASTLLMRTHMGVDLEPFPNVKAWVGRMEARESVRKSLPPL